MGASFFIKKKGFLRKFSVGNYLFTEKLEVLQPPLKCYRPKSFPVQCLGRLAFKGAFAWSPGAEFVATMFFNFPCPRFVTCPVLFWSVKPHNVKRLGRSSLVFWEQMRKNFDWMSVTAVENQETFRWEEHSEKKMKALTFSEGKWMISVSNSTKSLQHICTANSEMGAETISCDNPAIPLIGTSSPAVKCSSSGH